MKLALRQAREIVRKYVMTRRLVRKIMIEFLRENFEHIEEEGYRRKLAHYTSDLSDERLLMLVENVLTKKGIQL